MKAVVVAFVVGAASPALAEELPGDLAPTTRTAEVEAGTLVTEGDSRTMRELARNPSWLWGTARVFLPLDSPRLWGHLRLEASSNGTGRLWLDGFLPDHSHLVIRASRYRFPFAPVVRVPGPAPAEDAGALDGLEQSREQVEVDWERRLGSLGGRVDVALDFQRFAGTRPLLAGGLVDASPLTASFGTSAYRQTDDLTGGAMVGYAVVANGIRWRIAGGGRADSMDNRLLLRDSSGGASTGLTNLRDTARTRTAELVLSGASDQPAALMAGVSYRLTYTTHAPNVDHATEHSGGASGTVRSNDGDVRILRQHGAAGVVWQPVQKLRLAAQLDARSSDLDAHASQSRDLGTYQLVNTSASWEAWSLEGRMQGRYGLGWNSGIELDARGGLRRGQDEWNLRYLLADGLTDAGQRARALDRHLLTGAVELRLVARPLRHLRATVGARLEGWRSDEDVTQLVDAFRLGDRRRTRAGAYAAAQARLFRRLLVDGRATLFRDTWTNEAGGKDESWHYDVRLRATVTAGPLLLFAVGSLTEDRHDLSGGQAPPGYASLDFVGRSWVALGGATASLGRLGWISATYTLVANTADLTTRLQDAALSGSTMLPWRGLRLQLSVRYLDFHDRAPMVPDGRAVLGLLTLAGSF